MNRAGASLIVAMADPTNIYAIDDIKFLTGYNVEPVVASEPASARRSSRYYAEQGPSLRRGPRQARRARIDVAEDDEEVNVSTSRRRPRTRRSSSS